MNEFFLYMFLLGLNFVFNKFSDTFTSKLLAVLSFVVI